jgi:translation initiation factor IF-2
MPAAAPPSSEAPTLGRPRAVKEDEDGAVVVAELTEPSAIEAVEIEVAAVEGDDEELLEAAEPELAASPVPAHAAAPPSPLAAMPARAVEMPKAVAPAEKTSKPAAPVEPASAAVTKPAAAAPAVPAAVTKPAARVEVARIATVKAAVPAKDAVLAVPPPPEAAPALRAAAEAGTIELKPVLVRPMRVAHADVGEFLGDVQTAPPFGFAEAVAGTLALTFERD